MVKGKEISRREYIFRPLLRPFVRKLASEVNLKRFEQEPAEFFYSLTKRRYRWVGAFFLGVPERRGVVGPNSTSDSVKSNVVFEYRYEENGAIGPKVKLKEDIRKGYGVLLIERSIPLTEKEGALYEYFSKNPNNKYRLRSRHLHRVLFSDSPVPVKYYSPGRTKVIDRLGPKGRDAVAKFSLVICINPTTEFVEGVRSLISSGSLIVIYTSDFDFNLIRESLKNIDVLVCPVELASTIEFGCRRRTQVFGDDNNIPVIIENILEETGPRDLEVYVQITGEKEYWPDLFYKDAKISQVVICLDVARDEAPVITTSFSAYVEEFALIVDRLYVSEGVFYMYKDLLNRPCKLAPFLKMASLDGIRFDTMFRGEY